MLGTGDAGVDEPVRTRVGDVAADLAAAEAARATYLDTAEAQLIGAYSTAPA